MKIGIIGAGNIVASCLDALCDVDGVECCALFVRQTSYARAQQLCERYGIGTIYTDYDQMLANPDIDFVYIGIPNNMHFHYSLLALKAGKHVICEKPFTKDAEELRQLSDFAKQQGLFLFEAVTNIHAPNVHIAQRLLPKLGNIKMVQSNYSQLSSRYARYLEGDIHPAFDPQFAGGALYDINVYNLHLSCLLLGAPDQVTYTANRGYNGVDTSGVMVMVYPRFLAVCCGAKDSQSPGHFTIQGEKGYLVIEGTPNIANRIELHVDGDIEVFEENDADNHMVYEFRRFHMMYEQKDFQQCYQYLQRSLDVMQILEQGANQNLNEAKHQMAE